MTIAGIEQMAVRNRDLAQRVLFESPHKTLLMYESRQVAEKLLEAIEVFRCERVTA